MSFHCVLTGTGMKKGAPIYDMYGAIDANDEVFERGEITEDSGRSSDNLEYKEILNALARLAIIMQQANGISTKSIKGFGGYAITDDGTIYCEYCCASSLEYRNSNDFTKSDKVLFKIVPGTEPKVYANTLNGLTGAIGKYLPTSNVPKSGELNGCAGLFAWLVMYMLKPSETDTELDKVFSMELNRAFVSITPDAAFKVAMDLQTILRHKEDVEGDLFYNFDTITPMYSSFIQAGKPDFDVDNVRHSGDLSGFKKAWGLDDDCDAVVSHTLKDLYGVFELSPKRQRTEEELQMISEMKSTIDENMQISDTLIDIANDIQKSSNLKFHFRDYMLKGPTGTGKTTMCKVLGLLLNLPVLTFSCDPDTDQLALGCSIVPNAETEESVSLSLDQFMATMPSIDDMSFEPEKSYMRLTGETKENVSSDECMSVLLKKWAEVSEKQSKGFRYVYSNIAKAMKYGWIIEVQEPTVIQRPGVLTALNALTDDCGKLDLATGETIYRHPDAVMIYTTNLNLEGCFEMNQSQKSRFSQRTIDLPNEDEIVDRLMTSTGYTDKKNAKKMVKVYSLADNYAKSKSICDGAIDFRALQAWATANMIRKNKIYENGVTEFIEKCTDDPTQKAIFITSCLQTEFKPAELEKNKLSKLRL